ncbi:hypothetical protein [Helicobacter canis]|nr:hypothetical protein [Helicobacter canis]
MDCRADFQSARNDDVKVDSRDNTKNVKKPARILGFLGIGLKCVL